MTVTEDTAVERIGKVEFTIRVSDSPSDRTSQQKRVEALTRLLLAHWRLERGERFN